MKVSKETNMLLKISNNRKLVDCLNHFFEEKKVFGVSTAEDQTPGVEWLMA